MSSNSGTSSPSTSGGRLSWRGMPTRPIGWVGVFAAVVALGAAFVGLPLVTVLLRETAPVTDTVIMPLIGVVLLVTAAVLNAVALWPARQRNVLTLIATLITVPAALFFGAFLIGEGIAGV